ncbi:CotH kinase family protein [bacterium]
MMVRYRKKNRSQLQFLFIIVLWALGTPLLWGQSIVINEILASNQAGITDEDGDTSDWIELFNAGLDSIDLSGYMLTDESDEPGQWAFPSVVIHPDSFLLIWASGKNRQDSSYYHTNFKLNASGEYVGLYAPDSSLMDGVSFGSQRADISYGRFPDGNNHFTTFQNPTPGYPNQSEVTLSFSPLQGVYQGDIDVTLQTNCDTCKIYYTLDGSEPDSGDFLYSEAITVTVPTVIRARVFENGTAMTNIEARTYIVNDDPQLPVLSVITNPEHLWSKSTGIYHNYDSTGIGWERPCHLTLIEEGETKFSLPAGIRIHGGHSRILPKKNLRLYFRSEYGESELNYPLFEERPFTKYKRLVLYAPSHDQVTADLNSFTLIADALLHRLWFEENGIISFFRPVSLYLNGAYWGIFWIREYIDRHYIESNFGLSEFDLNRILKGKVTPTVREGDADYWLETYHFFENNHLEWDENYEIVKTKYLDIENYTDYHLFCIYAATLDWPHNNVDRFRDRIGGDPRWRFILWDHNFAWRKKSPYHKTLIWATRDEVRLEINPNDYASLLTSTLVLREMLENTDYRYFFINRFADLMNTVFQPVNIEEHLTSLENAIRPEMDRELQRWANNINIGRWNYAINNVRSFIRKRLPLMRRQILGKFYLSDTVRVTISPCVGEGVVTVNSVTPESLPWEGIYFQDVPIQIKATPASDYIFCHWADTTLPAVPELTMMLTGDVGIQAIFEEALVIHNIQVTTVTDSSSVIAWKTNRPAMAQVEYGPDTTYGYQCIPDVDPSSEHTVNLFDLQPEAMFHFRVVNWSVYGDTVISGDHTFQTESYLRFDEIKVDSVTCSEAHIRWTTNRPSFGYISYGIDSTLSSMQNDTMYCCHHECYLVNLNDTSMYYFRVESGDSSGHLTQSSILSFTTLSGPTGVHDNEGSGGDIPTHFKVSQNYPNPFNSTTRVDLEIPESGQMKVVVFNLAGQEVFHLYDGELSPGYKQITWDGTGFSGDILVSGVYILKAFFEGTSGTKERATARLVMIR